MPKELNKIKQIDHLRDRILGLVTDNFNYFREQPKELAWAMMNLSLVSHDLKYILIEAGEALDKKRKQPNKWGYKDSDLLYDAWRVTISNDAEFPDTDPALPLDSKPNKTLEEWVKLFTDRRYEYNDLFPNAFSVEDYLLCTIGTGYDWNSDGFIAKTGPSEVDEIIYAGYTRAEKEIRGDIRKEILRIRRNPLIAKHVRAYLREAKINAGKNKAEKTIVNDSWKVLQDIKKIPKKEQKELMKAFRDVAYLEAIVEEARNWTEEEWKQARKSKVYNYHGVDVDVSDITISHAHRTCGFGSSVKVTFELGHGLKDHGRLESYGGRNNKWHDFVYQLKPTNPKDVKKIKKIAAAELIINKASALELQGHLKDILGNKKPLKIKTPSEEEVEKARAYLNTHQPNLKKYGSLLEKAEEGDKKAAALLDKLAGVPARGWDSIRYLALDERREMHERIGRLENRQGFREDEKPRTHYSLSDYSLISTMPKNAHISYVDAGIRICNEIIDNPNEPRHAKKEARKALEKILGFKEKYDNEHKKAEYKHYNECNGQIVPEVGTPVIWDDDGNKCKGTIVEKTYDPQWQRTFYNVFFKEKDGFNYTRRFDEFSFSDDLSVDKRRLNRKRKG
jgi:hypothetical protein